MRLFVYPAALFLAFVLYCAAPKFAGGLARALQKLYALFQRLDARAPRKLAFPAFLLTLMLVPFLLAALVQTVQGSRVVTAVITAGILAGTEVAAAIDPVPLVLMVGAGACVFSYVTDPYFWLVQRATGDPPSTVVREYTLPLAGVGLLVLGAALLLQLLA